MPVTHPITRDYFKSQRVKENFMGRNTEVEGKKVRIEGKNVKKLPSIIGATGGKIHHSRFLIKKNLPEEF